MEVVADRREKTWVRVTCTFMALSFALSEFVPPAG